MRKNNNGVALAVRWSVKSVLMMTLLSLLSLSKLGAIQPIQIPWSEGITVQFQTGSSSIAPNQYIGINPSTGQLITLSSPDATCNWLVLRYTDPVAGPVVGFQSPVTGTNIQMDAGTGIVKVLNTNFHEPNRWEQWQLVSDGSSYALWNVVSQCCLSVRYNSPSSVSAGNAQIMGFSNASQSNQKIGTPSTWEQININVVNSNPVTVVYPSGESASSATGTVNAAVDGTVFAGSQWSQFDGQAIQITSNDSGVIWCVNEQGNIYFRNGVTSSTPMGTSWQQVSGQLEQIYVNNNNLVVGVNASGNIYARTGTTSSNPIGTGWVQLPGNSTYVSVNDLNQLYCIGTGSNVNSNGGGIFFMAPNATAQAQVSAITAQLGYNPTAASQLGYAPTTSQLGYTPTTSQLGYAPTTSQLGYNPTVSQMGYNPAAYGTSTMQTVAQPSTTTTSGTTSTAQTGITPVAPNYAAYPNTKKGKRQARQAAAQANAAAQAGGVAQTTPGVAQPVQGGKAKKGKKAKKAARAGRLAGQ